MRQKKLTVYPALRSGGDLRANFDSGPAVAMNERFSLSVGFDDRYDNDPGVGARRYDTLWTTGVSIEVD